MKRVRQEGEMEDDWASLCGDMVRALVHAEPALLPALYLVNKGFHAALDDNPNALYWEKYFNSVPGYSDYVPQPTWKDLVKIRRTLAPSYYLKVEEPCWSCGHLVRPLPRKRLGLRVVAPSCKCGKIHTSQDPITSWKLTREPLSALPVLTVDAEEVDLAVLDNFFAGDSSFRWRLTWNWRLQQIFFVWPMYTIRSLFAARAEDIPTDQQRHLGRFVGFA